MTHQIIIIIIIQSRLKFDVCCSGVSYNIFHISHCTWPRLLCDRHSVEHQSARLGGAYSLANMVGLLRKKTTQTNPKTVLFILTNIFLKQKSLYYAAEQALCSSNTALNIR